MKMYGVLIRDFFEWYFDRVVCKRFNIFDFYLGLVKFIKKI